MIKGSGDGGDIINRNLLLVMLLLLSIASLSVNCTYANVANHTINSTNSTALQVATENSNNTTTNQINSENSGNLNAADVVAPTVTAVNPSSSAVNVPKDKAITVTFSEPVKLGNGWIELQSSNGTLVPISKSVNNNTLSITPLSALIQGMKYTLLIHTGSVTDLAGNKVAGYVSRFTTSSDAIVPVVKSVDPSNGVVNVPKDKAITVTFSEPVKLGNGWIELQSSNGTLVPISKSVNNNTLSITPNVALNFGTRYAILIHTGSVTDSDGNKVAGCVSRFITSSDAIAPVVKSVNPSNGVVNVPKDKAITVTFSEPVKLGNGWIELQSSNGTLVPISKSVNSNTLSITPLSALIQGMKYTLLIHTGSVTDLAGNKVAGYVSRFTTTFPVVTFTSDQILDASARVKAYVELHHGLPSYVTIGSTNISMAKFLQMMSIEVLQINNGQTTSIPLTNVNSPTNPSDNVGSGNIYKTEYLDMAQRIKSFIDSNKVAPNYVSSSLGNVQFDSAVYMYSRIMNFYYTNSNTLPNYAAIKPWSAVTNPNSIPANLIPYTQPTNNCQSTDYRIVADVAFITNGATSVYDKAVKLYEWLHTHEQYQFYYNTQKGAVGTLVSGYGNCCDLTHLMVAFARAAGIPARYVHGTCTFSSGNVYGHVWAELYVNGQWTRADLSSYKNSFGVINNWNTATYTLNGYYRELPF